MFLLSLMNHKTRSNIIKINWHLAVTVHDRDLIIEMGLRSGTYPNNN